MYQQPNAPQSIGGVLDSGFKLYRESLSQAYLLGAIGAPRAAASIRAINAA